MNTSNIKKYAPKARNDFIAAMTKQAAKYGITDKSIEPVVEKGDLAVIGDSVFPSTVIKARAALVRKVEQLGFQQVVEQVAYSWFNRLCAIRYMELKGYLDHGRRVLSSADGSAGLPQILEDCLDVELPGLDLGKVRELKLDGTKDEALYRELLLGQCHALHQAMPFLFESVDDESELLLPENLTKTDSLIRELVEVIPEEDWQEVEVIGWLYQFYISEKKDQVIGKVVKSEDIPAATQLFTPNWIVKYLVQNSVGRQWLQTYPESPLKGQMEYYIEPAEQTVEVQEQLKAITPDQIDPESIKVLDPACGSGHILVEAYKVLKAIYEERGYRSRDIPQLILEKNLYGLDIDDRAAQLAGFALLMLAREDDRRIFGRELKLNVLAVQESKNIDLESNWRDAELPKNDAYKMVQDVWNRFEPGKTLGSLIDVPASYEAGLKALLDDLYGIASQGGMLQKPAAQELLSVVRQAWVLSNRYDAVVANPPYMGSKGMNAAVKKFTKECYPNSKADLFAIFMERAFKLLSKTGLNAQVNMQSWMFLSSYEQLRINLLDDHSFITMAHLGARAFSQISGEVVQTTAWVLANNNIEHYQPVFFRLTCGGEDQKKADLLARKNIYQSVEQENFRKIPGATIAYWLESNVFNSFHNEKSLSDVASPCQGVKTGENDRFLRFWHEVASHDTYLVGEVNKGSAKWFPCTKGGGYRKWYGNHDYVLNWKNDGEEIRNFKSPDGTLRSRPQNIDRFFCEGGSWSTISSSPFAMRYFSSDFTFESKGSVCFPSAETSTYELLSYANSQVVNKFLGAISPTLDYSEGAVGRLPFPIKNKINISYAKELVEIHRYDWDLFEISFDFKSNPLIKINKKSICSAYDVYVRQCDELITKALELEKENTNSVAEALSIVDDQNIALSDVTLNINPVHIYGSGVSEKNGKTRFKSDTVIDLISYAIASMMGRYSLDREGIVYSGSGNEGFSDRISEGAYQTFPVDDDGIIPLSDQEWFSDDATDRFCEFLKVVWGEKYLQENLDFVAESLCLHSIKPKKSESVMDTIRRYLSSQFYKDHLRIYKKRPIYWLFSSGKQKAFECLVYLHRYNEGTLARMRTEYVIPLTTKLAAHVEKLDKDVEASTSTAETKRLEKEVSQIHKQQAELAEFDEKLRHYADQRIKLDLDDGVKVNYGKFGDLLAEVKAVTGKKPE
jgi:type II restriction/modification system DNA methylase subunit YeeA